MRRKASILLGAALVAWVASSPPAHAGNVFSRVWCWMFPCEAGAATPPKPSHGKRLSQAEATRAVRELLTLSIQSGAARLAQQQPFAEGGPRRIALPGVLGSARDRLRAFNMAAPLDELEAKLNRAADETVVRLREAAIAEARTVPISDGLGLLRAPGASGAAFLRSRTEASMAASAQAAAGLALTSSGAFAALDKAGESSPLVAPYAADAKRDIAARVARAALEALWAETAEAERALRADPSGAGPDLRQALISARPA